MGVGGGGGGVGRNTLLSVLILLEPHISSFPYSSILVTWTTFWHIKGDQENLKYKSLLHLVICHKSDQNRMKNKKVTDICIVEN